MSLKEQGPVRERHTHVLSNQKVASIVDADACSVCTTNKCLHWSKAGRYSIHPSWLEKRRFNGLECMCFPALRSRIHRRDRHGLLVD